MLAHLVVEERRDDESADQTQVLEEGIGGQEALMSLHGPERMRDERSRSSEYRECSGTQPQPPCGEQQDRSAQFHGNGQDGEQRRRMDAEVNLLGHCVREVKQLREATDDI